MNPLLRILSRLSRRRVPVSLSDPLPLLYEERRRLEKIKRKNLFCGGMITTYYIGEVEGDKIGAMLDHRRTCPRCSAFDAACENLKTLNAQIAEREADELVEYES